MNKSDTKDFEPIFISLQMNYQIYCHSTWEPNQKREIPA